jgi:hypothetical protein
MLNSICRSARALSQTTAGMDGPGVSGLFLADDPSKEDRHAKPWRRRASGKPRYGGLSTLPIKPQIYFADSALWRGLLAATPEGAPSADAEMQVCAGVACLNAAIGCE